MTAVNGCTIWLTGLPAAGKTTLARELASELGARGIDVELLDGDVLRDSLNRDLGFRREDRDENVRRVAFVAELLERHGIIAVVALVSPYERARGDARTRLRMILVHVDCPLPVLEARDPKGLYRRFHAGELTGLTGMDDPYEVPTDPDVHIRSDQETPAASAARVIRKLEQDRLIPPP